METKQWVTWAHPSFKKGQATLELAIFGSILIMLLGALISYGLKYNFQQQVTQQAFRKALGLAADRRSASYLLVKDRHIPTPSDPFAVGSVIALSSSASVTRNYRLNETADKGGELPRVDIETPDSTESRKYVAAAFRRETFVPLPDLRDDYKDGESKYEYIYGPENIAWWITGTCGCTCGVNEETGHCPHECLLQNITIIDTCAGEIMDYNSLEVRCHQIKEAGIRVPWYCAVGSDKPQYALFEFSGLGEDEISALPDKNKPRMGLQSDYSQDTIMDNSLRKQESASGISTADTLNWQVTTNRTIVHNDGLTGGYSYTVVSPADTIVSSSVGPEEEETYEWQTSF